MNERIVMNLGRSKKLHTPFPLTPTLSLGEREIERASVLNSKHRSEVTVAKRLWHPIHPAIDSDAQRQERLSWLPLPKGEGRGEGEGIYVTSTRFWDHTD